MRAIIISIFLLIMLNAYAQDKKALDSLDNVLITEIIVPAQRTAQATGEEPNWAEIKKLVRDKYSAVQADRAVTKAQIYFYYSKNWQIFCSAIVHYTDTYEDKNDLKLMNMNAQMILQHCENLEELKSALKWIKNALDKEPGNAIYKTTYDALLVKTGSN